MNTMIKQISFALILSSVLVCIYALITGVETQPTWITLLWCAVALVNSITCNIQQNHIEILKKELEKSTNPINEYTVLKVLNLELDYTMDESENLDMSATEYIIKHWND